MPYLGRTPLKVIKMPSSAARKRFGKSGLNALSLTQTYKADRSWVAKPDLNGLQADRPSRRLTKSTF